jgi:hypothetical protein
MSEKYTVYDIVKNLIGEIEPVGAEHIDPILFDNLKATTELVDKLLFDIMDVANEYSNRHEDSVKKASLFASRFLDGVKDVTEEQSKGE